MECIEYFKWLIVIFFLIETFLIEYYNRKIDDNPDSINTKFINLNNNNYTKEEEKVKEKIVEEKQEKNIELETQNNTSEIREGNKNKTTISISYATDNKYIYPTIVSMTSLVANAGSNTFYNIYILHTPDLKESSKEFLNSVQNKYPDKCKIIYFNMNKKYMGLPANYRISIPTYYRLSLHELLLDVNRIIYLDGDTLIFDDLKELIELDMKGNVILGFLDSGQDTIESYGIKNATVVNNGVLLMDLSALRKYNYSQKINDFILKNRHNLNQEDQTIINVVMQGRIAPIPPKYGIWAFEDQSKQKKYLNKLKPDLKYNEKEFSDAIDHPVIVHFTWPKPFWRKHTPFEKEWWEFANKTGYYNEIYNNSPIPNIKWSSKL